MPETIDIAPFFIIGAGRSGTTLLRLILVGHSRIHIPPETWWIAPLVRHLPLDAMLTGQQLDRAVRIMTCHDRWSDMQITACQLRKWAKALDGPRLRDLINLVYAHHLRSSGKQRIGDKTPHYFAIVPQLAALYPEAKFIHLIRDGRDVAISWSELDWDRFYQRGFEWPHAMSRQETYRDTAIGRLVLEVRYEALVSWPERELTRICGFIGEDFEPAMLNPYQRFGLIPRRERAMHGMLQHPITDSRTQAWRWKLNAAECFAMEACLGRDLHRLGYPLRFAAPVWRPLLATVRTVLRLNAPLIRRAASFVRRRKLLPVSPYF